MNQEEQASDDRTVIHHPRIDLVLEEIESSDSVLDIGCVQHSADKESSDDHWLHGEIYEKTDDVLGLDYLEQEVEKLNERGYEAVCMDAEEFEIDEMFDVVTAGELIEHLSNPGDFLDRVHDHLYDDGIFVLTTPNPWYLRRFFEALLLGDVHCNPEHSCWFDSRTLEQLLRRHGFETVRFRYSKAPYFDRSLTLENFDAVFTRTVRKVGFNTLTGHSIVAVAEKAAEDAGTST